MDTFVYLMAYAGSMVCIGVVGYKIREHLDKPVQVSWEMCPLRPEETASAQGADCTDDSEWWERLHRSCGKVRPPLHPRQRPAMPAKESIRPLRRTTVTATTALPSQEPLLRLASGETR